MVFSKELSKILSKNMEDKMLRVVLLVIFFMLPAGSLLSNEILINVTGSEERKSYDGKPICDFTYDITNNSTGTIYKLSVEIDGWDDRGTKVDEDVFGAALDNSYVFDSKPIGLGSTLKFKQRFGFESPCKYMQKIKMTEITPQNCNIRMLPENVNCEKIVRIKSSVQGLIIE